MDEDHPNWFVGVDWASQTHHVVLIDARGRKAEAREAFDRAIALANTPAEAAHIRMHLDSLREESLARG